NSVFSFHVQASTSADAGGLGGGVVTATITVNPVAHTPSISRITQVAAWGYNSDGETNVPAGLSNVVAISAGGYHSVALKSDGTVVVWGYNLDFEVDVPAGLNNVVAIAAGFYHTVALKSDGTIVSWGYDGEGE